MVAAAAVAAAAATNVKCTQCWQASDRMGGGGGKGHTLENQKQQRPKPGLPPRLLETVGSLVGAPWLPNRDLLLVSHHVVQDTHTR